ncbi:hypothetical protein [Rathayibacter sp. VKM Ac-2801]|uniref:GAP1-N2 domain-containing protein n=1 Tax=Rathayibacter sp. VKM Ac-2801 TaxID=2609255 RepID=UPI00131FB863|nr:hypothetical protein [Rathayibacter sp. VKM Ac-2801]QHC69313.1 hypothetical protein GSU45_02205 [Rathayibacter sp. VKM Ac-2801]
MAEQGGAGGPRWSQATYTLDQGWRVQLQAGEPTQAEIGFVTASAVTSFGSHVRLSDFPAAAELEARPLRLMHLASVDGSAVYLQSSEAGADSTGRPDNVYNHVVFDRRPHEPEPPLRPVELWRSPDLLTPFSHLEVAAARLRAAGIPQRGAVVTLDSVVSFVCDPSTWRAGVLSVLMDASVAALRGGPPVVLIADSQDTGALWLGSVQRLMAPSTARTLSWSLYERASSLGAAWARGVHIAVVPRIDACERSAFAGAVVIDEAEIPAVGQAGGEPHVTAAGSEVAASNWSGAAQMVLVDDEVARRVLVVLDEAVLRVGDRGLAPEWPLAMAVVLLGDETMDARDEASRVLLDASPDGIRQDLDLYERTVAVVSSSIGSTTWGVWRELDARDTRSSLLIRELMGSAYLERCVSDAEWLLRDEGVPLPDQALLDADRERLTALAEAAIADLARPVDPREPVTSAVHALRLLDVVVRAGLLGADVGRTGPATATLLRTVAELLVGERGIAVAARAGVMSLPLRERLIVELEAVPVQREPVPGGAAPEEVLRWLAGDGQLLPSIRERMSGPLTALPPVQLSLAMLLLREGVPVTGLTATVAYSLLSEHAVWEQIPAVDRRALVRAAALPGAVLPTEFAALEEEFGGQFPEEFVAAALASAPMGDALSGLARRVQVSRPGLPSARFALVRLAMSQSATGELVPAQHVLELRDAVVAMRAAAAPAPVAADVGPRYLAAVVSVLGEVPFSREWRPSLERVLRTEAASGDARRAAAAATTLSFLAAEDPADHLDAEIALIRTFSDASEGAEERLRTRLESGAQAPRHALGLARLAFVTSDDFPDPSFVDPRAHALAALTVSDGAGRTIRLLDRPLRELAAQGDLDPEAVTAVLVDQLRAVVTVRGAVGGDKLLTAIERSAKVWQRELKGPRPRGSFRDGLASFLTDRKER